MAKVGTVKLKRSQKAAALLLAHGKSMQSVAENPDVRVSVGTLRKWMEDTDFTDLLYKEQDMLLTEVRHRLTPMFVDSTLKAMRTLRSQVAETNPKTREPNDPWIRLNAARALVQMGQGFIEKTEDKSITIRFDGMPVLGSPGSEKIEPADGSDIINNLLEK